MSGAVQYLSASDGTTIAYAAQGEGAPCVYLPAVPSHLEKAWEVDGLRTIFGWLAERFRLVRFDYRGTGLSQRGTVPCSVEHFVDDLDAVLARLDVGPAVVFAMGPSSLVAFAFAHRFPSRVDRLVLSNPVVSLADIRGAAGMADVLALAESNWELFTELGSGMVYGPSGERARQQAALLRAAATPAEYRAFTGVLEAGDVVALLPEIAAPTLAILPGEGFAGLPNSVRRITATLPKARMVTVAGRYVARAIEDPHTLAAIADFLGVPVGASRASAVSESTAVILFTDIVDSTALTERLGDAAFRTRARDLDERLRGLIRDGGGRSIDGKLLGDGVLAVFTSARGAIDTALRCRDAAGDLALALHVGLHAGDVIDEGGNVYGGAVNVAARVAAAAAPGELLVTDTVRNLARTSATVNFADRGEQQMKGLAEPVRLFAVSPR